MAQPIRIVEAARTQRVNRHPQHPFQVRVRPWQIAPFFIAPVLPGETVRNILLQSRVLSDPVKSHLVGWWNEYYFFYVKHRDLGGRDSFSNMMLDPSQSLAAFNQAALVEYYHGTTTISWVKECLQRVTETYFRQDGDAWTNHAIGNLPGAQIKQTNDWMDSVINDAARVAAGDVNVDLNANAVITASEVDKALFQWQLLRSQGMTNITYEDYLASYGVRPGIEEAHIPELVRYIRDWAYPASHVDPTTGNATSALSWKVVERADKDRYCKEPGFIFGVTVKRPKVYLSKQKGTVTDIMIDLYSWLPAVLRPEVEASFRKIAAVTPPLSINTDAYWVDLKDLFLYGEQFVNFALTEVDAGLVALPTAGLEKRFASSTDADALFAAAAPANQIREDGIVSLSVTGPVIDTSQTI
jgi:hypothetical protein